MNSENEIMIEETIEDIDHDQDLEEVLDETRLQRHNFRQNRGQPRRFDDYELGADESLLTYMCETGEPTTCGEAMSSKHRTKWKEAIQNEIGALKKNKTWIVEENPKGVGVIDCKWVFKEKKDEVGNIVARGFQQTSECILDI
ncbi:hypothetical protein JTB14_017539 [Gonioctena quinquepunctata]|nr:hypothetical protein JTB14_017539 [Gonioctena quinquepunctata]